MKRAAAPTAVRRMSRAASQLSKRLRRGDHKGAVHIVRCDQDLLDPLGPAAPRAWPVLGRQRLAPGAVVARDLALGGSAMLVLGGGVDLSAFGGRARLERGMLAIRPRVDCRAARASCAGADLLHLPWRFDPSLGGVYDGIDVDRLACAAPSAACAAIEAVVATARPRAPERTHWADHLAAALAADATLGIARWSAGNGLSREGVARGFRRAYGVAPARFRLEIRARAAWVRIVSGAEPLSLIALETGFADQAHMTRTVGWLTGRPPRAWRRAWAG
jgi:AraC-like DNA-binding protein